MKKSASNHLLALVAGMLLCLTTAASMAAEAPSGDSSFQNLSLRLKGIIILGNSPQALITMSGVEEELLVGEGDLVEGYTVQRIEDGVLTLTKGNVTESVAMENSKIVKADTAAKVYTPEYNGPDSIKTIKVAEAPLKVKTAACPVEVASAPSVASPARAKKADSHPAFVRPVKGGWISSTFGFRSGPMTNIGIRGSSNHEGIDIAGPSGTMVHAAADGVVRESGWSFATGQFISVKHDDSWETRYYHLSRRYVAEGEKVKAGQNIAASGNSGASTGPHLHFEIRKDGRAINPANFIYSLRKY